MKILPCILSGGFGTRLWPLSRQKMPKQFLNGLFDNQTLFSKALQLVNNKDIFLPPLSITHQDHKFFAADEYQSLNLELKQSIILEPCSRNTAIAIISACLHAIKIYNDTNITLLILPSDHLIKPKKLFEESIINATEMVNDKIITFGIKPTFPATGYGYIKKDKKISDNCFAIKQFCEKPNQETAELFLEQGNYLWNAGIFLLNANIYLQECQKYLPKQLDIAKKAFTSARTDEIFCELDLDNYQKAEDISIDYGVLEKSKNIALTEMKANWSDVGDFKAIYETKDKDSNNNVKEGNVITYDTHNSFIHSKQHLITCLGLNNIIAIETDDTILLADKEKSQDVKKIVKDLLSKNREEVQLHNRVFRPWGYYETLNKEQNFKVKKILVKPGQSLSLQMHEFRSEHWVVIKGIATIQKEGDIFDLETGKSTFIPIKTKHRLSNNSNDTDLEIIEVQMGQKVEEEDIIRFEDVYGRK